MSSAVRSSSIPPPVFLVAEHAGNVLRRTGGAGVSIGGAVLMVAPPAAERTGGLAGSSGVAAFPAPALDLPHGAASPAVPALSQIPVSVPMLGG